ncbi:Mis12 protein-domain-containing protein [Podospora australis]|uniref:Mis12 protein-domain-containing protein n=1 Tax=Podospora australis TaxID=1536484 RepID=A0AAN7AI68_9PEZI|nr:Mis12 protein-domain-containing protein [Podospora australis]
MSRSDTELLTEHFGYPPIALLDVIINSINQLADRALASIEQGLLNAPPAALGFRPPKYGSEKYNAAEAHRNEVESGVHQLETLLFAVIDKNFDKFEIYVLRYILTVKEEEGEWVRLRHYEGLDFSKANTGEGAIAGQNGEGINKLRRRLQASQKLNGMLEAEKARNEALLREMRRLVGYPSPSQQIKEEEQTLDETAPSATEGKDKKPPFQFLRERGDLTVGDAETPLTTTTAFTLSQLQSLQKLSGSLRKVMPDLASSSRGGDSSEDEEEEEGGKKSWRRERLEYVETATRKHLENVRGLELGKNGEVRDGEWDGEGRSLGKGEVEGLERVVGMLGVRGAEGDENEKDQDQEMVDGC